MRNTVMVAVALSAILLTAPTGLRPAGADDTSSANAAADRAERAAERSEAAAKRVENALERIERVLERFERSEAGR